MYIYVASSWRNPYQQGVVKTLREHAFEVYDFKNPEPGDDGFHWSAIDPAWQQWSPIQFRDALSHPRAAVGFAKDWRALDRAELTILVLPCGASSHLELGYARGREQRTAILMPDPCEPELMYKLADAICTTIEEVLRWLAWKGDVSSGVPS